MKKPPLPKFARTRRQSMESENFKRTAKLFVAARENAGFSWSLCVVEAYMRHQ